MARKAAALELHEILTTKEFGAYLERLRGAVSARKVSVGICTPVHLRDIERGMRVPSELILYKLAEKYNLSPKELIFAMRRIIAPDQTKGYYRISTSTSISSAKEHRDMIKDIDSIKRAVKELKAAMDEINAMLKRK